MVRVGVRQELKMRDLLLDMGLDVWVPQTTKSRLIQQRRRRNGMRRKPKKEETRLIIFDGHVLVRFVPSPEAYHAIINIHGVHSIYARPGSFESDKADRRLESALSPKVIERLRELETETHTDAHRTQFKAGDCVTRREGPFAGYRAIVSGKPATWGLLCIEVDIMGRKAPVVVDESQIEAK